MKRKTLIFIVLIIIASIPALKALSIPDFYTSHDGVTHTARIANYYLALKEGQFPPRLAPNLFGNLGFPIFIFIYPLPYLLGALFFSIGFTFTQAFEIVIGLSFVLSAITMFLFAKELFGNVAALLAALFYSWAPYRFSQVYVRAAIAESFAYIFIPLVLLSLIKVSKDKEKRKTLWIGIGSLSLAGLLLSHQLVSLMFLPVFTVFVLLFLFQSKKRKYFIKYVIAIGLLGFSISAFIYFPALFERSYLQFDRLISYYSEHFVTIPQLVHSPWSYGFSMKGTINDDMSFQVGLTHLLAFTIATLLIFYQLIKFKMKVIKRDHFLIGFISLCIFAVSILLMLEHPIIHWIWKSMPGISIIDIPWRLLGVSVFATSIIAAYIYSVTGRKLIFIILVFFVFYANRNHLRINKTLIRNDEYFLSYLETATWQNEFLPQWRKTNKWQNVEPDYRVNQGSINVKPKKIRTNNISLTLQASQNSKLDIHRLYFPGWMIILDGKQLKLGEDFEISESIQVETETSPYIDRSGFPSINIPSGNHELQAHFKETPLRKIGFLISTIGIITTLVVTFHNNLIRYLSTIKK